MTEQFQSEPEDNNTKSLDNDTIANLVARLTTESTETLLPDNRQAEYMPSFADQTTQLEQDEEQGEPNIPEEAIRASVDVEQPIPTQEESFKRMLALNCMALHYYYASNRNWLDAYTNALDELAAVCLANTESPVSYHDEAAADLAAITLGYPNYVVLADDIASKTVNNHSLLKFSDDTVEFAKNYWFANRDFADVTPTEYARAVTSELRSNWPAAKSAAAYVIPRFDEEVEDDVTDSNGEPAVFVGVNEVDEMWNPLSLSIMSKDAWEQMCEEDEATLGTDEDTCVDEEILSLVYLQSYQWTDRSWNKAHQNAKSFCDSVCTFCWSAIANDFVAPDTEETQQRIEEMDRLALELMDENGNIALRQIQLSRGRVDFDPPSKRFIELYDAQQKVESFTRVRQINEGLLPVMSKLEGSTAQLLVDDVLASVYERAGGRDEAAQRKALDDVRNDMQDRLDKNQKQYKSKWKKYLSDNKEYNEAIKRFVAIIDEDNGLPIFDPKGMQRMHEEIEQEHRMAEEKEQEKQAKKKKRH